MLTHLQVSNYALIDQLSLNFDKGLTIITGETGAGKSILLGALRLVLGERADLKSVKDQNQKCMVEAHFDLKNLDLKPFFDENDLEYEENTILRREILPSGKSRAFVNDSPVVLPVLNELSQHLIDIHSQFETAELLKDSFQFSWVDTVAGNQTKVIEFRNELSAYQNSVKQLKDLKLQKAEFQKEFDYNSFLFNELSEAALDNVSLEELEQELYLLENAEDIAQSLSDSLAILENEEYGLVLNLNAILSKSKDFPQDLKERLYSLQIEVKDIQDELNETLEKTEINPERLSEVQNKLNILNSLIQKHHVNSVEELIEIREQLNEKLKTGLNVDERAEALTREIQKLENSLQKTGKEISVNRKKAIPGIENEILCALQKMGMPNSQIRIDLITGQTFNSFGTDQIQLLFSANKGMEAKSIEKAVSGGERSRLMLAIKQSVARHRELPTLILDEIDTGVSGKIAESVGEIMSETASNIQIMAITHLPQVAAFGNQHIKVLKSEEEGLTKTKVQELTEDERIEEIAQMLSGKKISDAAVEQAKQLLNTNSK